MGRHIRSDHIDGSDESVANSLVVWVAWCIELAHMAMISVQRSDFLVVVPHCGRVFLHNKSISGRHGLVEGPQAQVFGIVPEGRVDLREGS